MTRSTTRGRERLVDVEVRLVHQTEAAYLVDDECGHKEWLSKSRCQFDQRPTANGEPTPRQPLGTLTLPERLAIDKGLV